MWPCPFRSTPHSPTSCLKIPPSPSSAAAVSTPSGSRARAHDRNPEFAVKRVSQVLDTAAALTPELMQLGRWIAQYYIAPIGEVLRTMLPLSGEFRRVIGYRITDKGVDALHAASTVGS